MGRLENDIRDAARGRMVPSSDEGLPGAVSDEKKARSKDVNRRFEKVSEEKLRDEVDPSLALGSKRETLSDIRLG